LPAALEAFHDLCAGRRDGETVAVRPGQTGHDYVPGRWPFGRPHRGTRRPGLGSHQLVRPVLRWPDEHFPVIGILGTASGLVFGGDQGGAVADAFQYYPATGAGGRQ
jgi:hypothetical protein